MEEQITVLYTHKIHGHLDILPRMATLIRELKTQATGDVLLLDAGESCSDAAPICQDSEGRAAVMVMDAMGYHAVNVTGIIDAQGREKLRDNYLNTALADAQHPFVWEGIAFAAAPPDAIPHRLHIAFETAHETHLSTEPVFGFTYTLTLAALNSHQVGQVILRVTPTSTELIGWDVLELLDNTLADPTIAGTVDFVKDEVRYYKRVTSHKKNTDPDA